MSDYDRVKQLPIFLRTTSAINVDELRSLLGDVDADIVVEDQLQNSIDWGVATNILSTYVAIISAFIALHTLRQQKEAADFWDADKLMRKIRSEMLVRNITDYDIIDVKDFDKIYNGQHDACKVVVRGRDNSNYIVYVYGNGNSLTVSL